LGNVWNKAKEKGKRVKLSRRNSKSDTFGIDDVEPVPVQMTPISTENDDFDPLSFFGGNESEKNKKTKSNSANQQSNWVNFDKDSNKKHSKQKQDTFGDLFGDLSSSKQNNKDNNHINAEPILQKKSVKDLMQTAYKQPSKPPKPKATNVFDDLFD